MISCPCYTKIGSDRFPVQPVAPVEIFILRILLKHLKDWQNLFEIRQ
jgi:hypothetical protein